MAKVKIFLDKGETLQEAESDLYKAYAHHIKGDVHQEDAFEDPAMNDVSQRLIIMHEIIYKQMIDEISEVLKSQFGS